MIWGLIAIGWAALAAPASGPSETVSILNPELYRTVIEKREVSTRVRHLTDKPFPTYSVSSALLISSPAERIQAALKDYPSLKRMSPYFHRVEFHPKSRILVVTGKVLTYEFGVAVQVDDRIPKRVRYTQVNGPSEGMGADVMLEPSRPSGTLVYLEAAFQVHTAWVPQWMIERATRLLVGTVASKLREKIEKKPGT